MREDDAQVVYLLTTFGFIKGQVFRIAAEAAKAVVRATGMDPADAVVQVGKALNDPARGPERLQGLGVTFTQAQRDQIKRFARKRGRANLERAQRLILSELTAQFG